MERRSVTPAGQGADGSWGLHRVPLRLGAQILGRHRWACFKSLASSKWASVGPGLAMIPAVAILFGFWRVIMNSSAGPVASQAQITLGFRIDEMAMLTYCQIGRRACRESGNGRKEHG